MLQGFPRVCLVEEENAREKIRVEINTQAMTSNRKVRTAVSVTITINTCRVQP
jgi:hypothetical protein